MNRDLWIIIPDWERFQSYAAARPAWIKLWTDINSNEKWADSSVAVRGCLCTIWAEYARSSGRIRVRQVMQVCGKSARSAHIDALVHAGFIQLSSSKPQSLRAHARARSREAEAETEEEVLQAVVEPSTVPFPEQPPPLNSNQPASPSRNGTPAHEFENDLIPLDPHAMLRQIGDAP